MRIGLERKAAKKITATGEECRIVTLRRQREFGGEPVAAVCAEDIVPGRIRVACGKGAGDGKVPIGAKFPVEFGGCGDGGRDQCEKECCDH